MTDIDRSDEFLELMAEEQRRDELRRNGFDPDDPGPVEPPPPDDDADRFATDGAEREIDTTPPFDDDRPVYTDRILTRSALRNLPDPEPLIDNVLDQGTTALLYGSWSTAKTFIALDWASSAATGPHWQGRDIKQRRVL